MNRTHNVTDLRDIPNPSALVSLQFWNRNNEAMAHLPAFKNLTDLDISCNNLSTSNVQLNGLRFLRRLNLEGNCIDAIQGLPKTIEHLNLANNQIEDLDGDWLQTLGKLHTINLTNNRIRDISWLCNIANIRWLFLGFNNISSIDGISNLWNLIEIDLEYNRLEQPEWLWQLSSSVSVVNVQGNPCQRKLMLGKFHQQEDLSYLGAYDLWDVETGILYRNVERLKELKTSRFRSRIQALTNREEKRDTVKVPEFHSQRHHSVDLDEIDSAALKQQISELRIDNYTMKARMKKYKDVKEKFTRLETEYTDLKQTHNKLIEQSTNDNELFDDLIAYWNFDVDTNSEFSFSHDKFEIAVELIKRRENERRQAVDESGQLKYELDILKSHIYELNATIKATPPSKNFDKITKLRTKNKKLKTIWIDQLKKLSRGHISDDAETTRLREENAQLKDEIANNSNDLIGKIRELENQNEMLQSSSSFSHRGFLNTSYDSDLFRAKTLRSNSPLNSSSIDLSYFRKNSEDGKVVINKKVGQYIERLKDKIGRMHAKIMTLRKQRDSFKTQVHSFH